MKYTRNNDELLCVRAYEVIQNLNLAPLKNHTDKPNNFFTRNADLLNKDEIKKEVMRLGYGEPSESTFTWIEKVFKQIIYYLKYND
jgi:hypothetical protein